MMLPLNVRSYWRDCCRFGASTDVEDGDHVATVGENRKFWMRVFKKADGLTWLDSAGRKFTPSPQS
jgi:hypothetical protein